MIKYLLILLLALPLCAEEVLVELDHGQAIQIRPDGHAWTTGELNTNVFIIIEMEFNDLLEDIGATKKNFKWKPGGFVIRPGEKPQGFINYPFCDNGDTGDGKEKFKLDKLKSQKKNKDGKKVKFKGDPDGCMLVTDDAHH